MTVIRFAFLPVILPEGPYLPPRPRNVYLTREEAAELEVWHRLPPIPPLPPEGTEFAGPPIDPCPYCQEPMYIFPRLKGPLDQPRGQFCLRCRSTRPA